MNKIWNAPATQEFLEGKPANAVVAPVDPANQENSEKVE